MHSRACDLALKGVQGIEAWGRLAYVGKVVLLPGPCWLPSRQSALMPIAISYSAAALKL